MTDQLALTINGKMVTVELDCVGMESMPVKAFIDYCIVPAAAAALLGLIPGQYDEVVLQ